MRARLRQRGSGFGASVVFGFVGLIALSGCDGEPNGVGPAAASPKGGRIVFVTNGEDPYWYVFRDGMKDAAEELKIADEGFSVAFEPNDGTPRGQLEKLRQLASQSDVAGVSLSPVDANNQAIADALRALREKGIPVICVDGDMDRTQFEDARAYYMGTNNLEAGRALGTALAAILQARGVDGGSYVQFVGRTSAFNGKERMDGVAAAMGDYEEADRMADEFSRSRAQENVRQAMNNHPGLVALVGIYAYNGPAMADVVRERKADDLVVGTMDAAAQSIELTAKGELDVLVAQNPFEMGRLTVKVLRAMVQSDRAVLDEVFPPGADGRPTTIHTVGLRVVVPDVTSSPAAKADYADDVEVLSVEDLKAWLAERNLTST